MCARTRKCGGGGPAVGFTATAGATTTATAAAAASIPVPDATSGAGPFVARNAASAGALRAPSILPGLRNANQNIHSLHPLETSPKYIRLNPYLR